MGRTKTVERTEAVVTRGDRVEVHEENIKPWRGVVGAVKFSPVSGWWVDVRRDGDDKTWSVTEDLVRLLPREEPDA